MSEIHLSEIATNGFRHFFVLFNEKSGFVKDKIQRF